MKYRNITTIGAVVSATALFIILKKEVLCLVFKFNKQFMFFLFQNIFVGICGLIDTGFGNQINIDSVCVLSAYTVITWATYATYSIGAYAYRVVLSKTKSCFLIQVSVSILLGVLVYLLSPIIPHMYSLTDAQYELFEQCLKIHAISCPVLAIREFLGNYVEYQCKNKQAITGNIILYGTMIATDAFVICHHGSLTELLWFTLLCSLICSLYELFFSGFLKEPFRFNIQEIKELLWHDANTCFDRITGKVATIVFNIYVSKLGTDLYAIHCVCYAIGIFSENFTNALFTYEVITLANKSSHKFQYCVKITKKYAMFLIIAAYAVCYGLLLFTHGAVLLQSCLLYTGLYCTEIFALLLYTPMMAYLTSMQQTHYLKYGGIVGIMVRIPVTIIGYYTGMGLYVFSVAAAIDYASRGIYFYICSKKFQCKSSKRCLSKI